MTSEVSNDQLMEVRKQIELKGGSPVRAWQIKDAIAKKWSINLDESTIRGRFIEMDQPLSGKNVGAAKPKEEEDTGPKTERQHIDNIVKVKTSVIPENIKSEIPRAEEFIDYVERDIDRRLAVHYNIGPVTGRYKYPITQGKQGTGKTYSHKYYAFRNGLPFFLYSCYEDFKLAKLFGDKTIKNGSIQFQESMFVRAIQGPCVILFDEINAVSNANSFDFHALLQNRELFTNDANDGQGRIYKLHPECRIGFAQNPKSAKYIGGHIKPSNFLGRCTYLTYPEFKKAEIKTAISRKFPKLVDSDLEKFVKYYFAVIETIERSKIPVDISIRQINNVIDLWVHGLSIKDALEDGLSSILEAVSQPKAKESFFRLAQAVWIELM